MSRATAILAAAELIGALIGALIGLGWLLDHHAQRRAECEARGGELMKPAKNPLKFVCAKRLP